MYPTFVAWTLPTGLMRRTPLASSSWTESAPPSLRLTICVSVFSRRTFHKESISRSFASWWVTSRWSLLWPSMGLGGPESGTSEQEPRTSRNILPQTNSPRLSNSKQDHLVCVSQVSDPAQRRRGPGSGTRGLPHHLRFAVCTTSLACHTSQCFLIA